MDAGRACVHAVQLICLDNVVCILIENVPLEGVVCGGGGGHVIERSLMIVNTDQYIQYVPALFII